MSDNPARLRPETDPYEQDLMACVHCGLCLNSCPTYLVTGSEADSPRGRIVLMAAMHRGELDEGDRGLLEHIDRCLGCRSCETACPSGVAYGRLVEAARSSANSHRGYLQRTARQALLESLTSPAAMQIVLKVAGIAGGMPSPVASLIASEPDPASASEPLPLPQPKPSSPLPTYIPPVGQRRARVGMLTGCVMRVLYGDVNSDTAAVLAANGCEVLATPHQECCGALHVHNGFHDRGQELARKLIDAFTPFDGLDAIVVNSAGCGSTMKEYAQMLAGDPQYGSRARAFSSKVRDFSEWLDELGWVAPLRPMRIKATYHDACHLGHAQRITAAPRRLLEKIPEMELAPLAESDICCGSAGIYNLTEPLMAKRLRSRKVSNIRDSGAAVVVTSNPGCMAWIESGLHGAGIRIVHPATLLREALLDQA